MARKPRMLVTVALASKRTIRRQKEKRRCALKDEQPLERNNNRSA